MAVCPACHRQIAEGITCACQRRLVRAPADFRAQVRRSQRLRPDVQEASPPTSVDAGGEATGE